MVEINDQDWQFITYRLQQLDRLEQRMMAVESVLPKMQQNIRNTWSLAKKLQQSVKDPSDLDEVQWGPE